MFSKRQLKVRSIAKKPQFCETPAFNYTNGVLMGDTMACRTLHLIGTGLRPVIHCDHLRNVSVKCRPQDCPAATRLAEPLDLTPVKDSGHGLGALMSVMRQHRRRVLRQALHEL